jgi:hypothetical protein
MATYYSILSALIRPEIQEKITVGLLLIGDNDIFFEYSKDKLNSAKSLLSESAYLSFKDALKNLEATVTAQQNTNKKHQISLEKKGPLSDSYIEYLSRYNNNILGFTSPKEIELEANASIFSNLYKKFIDDATKKDEESLIPEAKSFIVNNRDILAKHFNIDEEITFREVPNLIVPVTVSLIGQNEVATFVQSLNLEKRTDKLSNDISEILFLQKAFSTSQKESVAIAITQEPDKKLLPKQHEIWQQLRNTKDIINYDISEAQRVIEYAQKHDVRPFLKEEV